MIGSQTVKDLHQLSTEQNHSIEQKQGSESAESLLKDEIQLHHQLPEYDGKFSEWFEHDEKILRLIQAPVLVSTIDYLMPATEGMRGGRQIAPMLRLLTSDLVLDEPDDFGLEDLPALCRLVNWAGMLGSRVLLSTATISPELASALFEAYQQGRKHYTQVNAEKNDSNAICCAWFDEYKKPISHTVTSLVNFNSAHEVFIDKRVKNLNKDTTNLRKSRIIPIDLVNGLKPSQIFSKTIFASLQQLHKQNFIENNSGKKISIGLVRMANINPLVAVAKHLYATQANEDTKIYYCVYHSQYPLVLRSHIETQLDKALTRHNETTWWSESGIQKLSSNSDVKNHIFVVLATSVAEVGRDHDYDWAVVEPSSMRSIIQLAGRVQRHRKQVPKTENIHILNKNFKALRGETLAYLKPGYESNKRQFYSHQLSQLLADTEYSTISSIPRIKKITPPFALTKTSPPKFKSFSELEHIVQHIRLFGNDKEENFAQVWWQHDVTWCGEIQRNQPFRHSYEMEDYNLNISYSNKLIWQKKRQNEYPAKYEPSNDIVPMSDSELKIASSNVVWFEISINQSLEQLMGALKYIPENLAYKKFTHIQLRKNNNEVISRWKYHENLGVFKDLKKDGYIDEK